MLLATALLPLALAADQPNPNGLRLWLDASDAASLAVDPTGIVTAWRDRSPAGLQCQRRGTGAPRVVATALNGRAVVRLDGQAGFEVPAIRDTRGAATVFVVSRRPPAAASEELWQRLVSSWNGEADDTRPPSFNLLGHPRGLGEAYEATVWSTAQSDVALQQIAIGYNRSGTHQGFRGDLAEVLIYDRGFLAFDETRAVIDYLAAKWNARILDADRAWTRVGLLGETPQRVSDSWPLSDQRNTTGWQPLPRLSDEFAGALDSTRWESGCEWWPGRQPAWFNPANGVAAEGSLQLTMRCEEPPERFRPKGYHTYTSAWVSGRQPVLYGYFEVRARPMPSAGSSSFWFIKPPGDKLPGDRPTGHEIDVFELGGKAPGYERKYNMNAHATRPTGDAREPFSSGGVWVAPWDFAADFHVFGFQWDAQWLQWFVDGVLVRRAENTCWHYPLLLVFDSETMPTWFGLPQDADLPSTFHVDYLRAWQPAPR
ncbi:MAG: family 16 glycosylhydrolase [Fimbriimonadaceae bacterium]|nr:family 16 glycosylhydrolase [Fimbriimonadaceae bacterium]